MAKGLGDAELSSIVSHQIALAKDYDRRERKHSRAKALDYYLGNMTQHLPSEENRSSVVSLDFKDVVQWLMPQLMRVFAAGDKLAIAEPVGPEDIEYADDVTEGLNYVFWKENDGYQVIYDGTWDSLVQGNSIIKTYWDDTPVYKTSFHSGLSDDQLAMLLMAAEGADGPEVLAHSAVQGIGPDGMPVQTHDVKIKRQSAKGAFVVTCIPEEKFLIHADAINTEDAAFCGEWDDKMRSDLVAMGYDKDKVWAIPASGKVDTAEDISRLRDDTFESPDTATEMVRYFEVFVRIDVDGDGEAELVRVCSAGDDGGTLLDWEVWEDELPYDDIKCKPIPHRWVAGSIFDDTEDVQRIKSVLQRNALDNLYATNNPRWFLTGEVSNPDELMNPSFGGTVMGKPGSQLLPLAVPFVANHAFDVINYQDQVVQRRTGVSRQTMALDPEALQNQTATATAAERDSSYTQVEMLARNMANGWRKVFRKLMHLMIKHQDQPKRILVKEEVRELDPRHWNADMDVTINVGLGTGSRDRDAQMLGSILQQQVMLTDRLSQGGFPDKALEMLTFIRTTLTQFAQATGIKNPDAYWPEVNEEDIAAGKQRLAEQAQQPDPKVQAEMQKAQADQQMQAMKMQADQQNAQMQMQMEREKAEADLMLRREQMQMEMQLKRSQLEAELMLKREQLVAELELKRELGVLGAQTQVATSAVHPGGDPG